MKRLEGAIKQWLTEPSFLSIVRFFRTLFAFDEGAAAVGFHGLLGPFNLPSCAGAWATLWGMNSLHSCVALQSDREINRAPVIRRVAPPAGSPKFFYPSVTLHLRGPLSGERPRLIFRGVEPKQSGAKARWKGLGIGQIKSFGTIPGAKTPVGESSSMLKCDSRANSISPLLEA